MSQPTASEQVLYIFKTGKLIHDRSMKIQSQYLAENKRRPFADLSLAPLRLVPEIRDRQALTMSGLADTLEVSQPSASAMVQRLVDKGILYRERSTEDRRKVVVRISPDSVKEIEVLENNILQLFMQLVNKVGPDTTRQWCAVPARIKQALDAEAAKHHRPSA
jgi:DNA-binding MarR family transcriptional regulator